MTADELLAVFDDAAKAARTALEPLTGVARRERTERPGQYALDLVADAAVLPILHEAGIAVVSEESGRSGRDDAAITAVLDPVDGSTNCSRDIPYWAISLCALDADGPWCALVQNGATGARYTAVRSEGAQLDRATIVPAATTEIEHAVVALSGWPPVPLAWRQFRALGSAALALCDIAAGHLDGYLDGHADQHAPWDYLGALLVCQEAGAVVADADGRDLVALDASARRQLVAAGTKELLQHLQEGTGR